MLKILRGEPFREKLHQYAKLMLIKGVPALITDLKEAYHDKERT